MNQLMNLRINWPTKGFQSGESNFVFVNKLIWINLHEIKFKLGSSKMARKAARMENINLIKWFIPTTYRN